MAILDNRTALSGFETGDTPAAPDDLSGAVGGTADTEIFIEGSRSYGYYTSNTRDGLLYDAGSAQNWANNTFYIWFNTGIAGLLGTLANGGVAIRFCGNTVTNWFEVNIAGSDAYPAAVSGGWVMLVVDIEKAKLASDRTNGTPPLTSAIRYVGVTTITNGTMPRMADNTWLDKIWRLPSNTPGILVEGQNGANPWTWADIASTAEANSWGTAKVTAGGAIAINTPIRFGDTDNATHDFEDTNAVVLWEDWDVATNFYSLEVIGGTGSQNFTLGVRSGTGEASAGSQGGVIAANPNGERWQFLADDANIDLCGLYGVSMSHGIGLAAANSTTEVVSCNLVDFNACQASGIGLFVRNIVVNANTTTGTGFLSTESMDNIDFCTFNFSAGHAIELVTGGAASQTSKGNRFTGYGVDDGNDAAIWNNTGASRTISLADGSILAEHTVRTVANTTIVAGAVTLTLTVSDINTQAVIEGARVLVYAASGGSLPADASVSISGSGTTATVTHTSHGLTSGDQVVIGGDGVEGPFKGVFEITVTGTNTYTYTARQTLPATASGTPVSSQVIINALTSALGVVSDTRSYGTDQPVRGFVRKSSTSPVYRTAPLAGNTVDSGSGATIAVQLIPDAG